MLYLNLNEEERSILYQLLESCISDLRVEIARTENIQYKMMLKQRKEVLKKVYESLQQAKETLPER
ncbi:MAG: hypothetical protein HPY59_02480 [Anaerolineae bacterium]|nr:hypothetical protein [Anaerolineae bacterium]